MSQVYSSPGVKYYTLPGLNLYVMTSDNPAPDGFPIQIPFDQTLAASDKFNLVEFNNTGTSFEFLNRGMYNITVNLAYKSLNNNDEPAPVDSNVDLYLQLERPGQFDDLKISRSKFNCPAQSSTLEYNVLNVSCTTYFRRGDIVRVFFENLVENITTILTSDTILIISQIN